MAATPENKVKSIIKKRLESLAILSSKDASKVAAQHKGKYHMPVPSGYGVQGIPDFYGHYRGFFFEIEAKAEGKEPSPLQRFQLVATATTGAASFVIDRPEGMDDFAAWTRGIDAAADKTERDELDMLV